MSLSDIVLPAGAALQTLTALCDASFDSVLVTDVTGTIVYANAAFRQLTGYSLEAVRGKNPKILQGPATDARVLERLTSVLKAGDGTFEGSTQPTLYCDTLSLSIIICRIVASSNLPLPLRQSHQLQERRHRLHHALARCPRSRRRRRRVLAGHPARGGQHLNT